MLAAQSSPAVTVTASGRRSGRTRTASKSMASPTAPSTRTAACDAQVATRPAAINAAARAGVRASCHRRPNTTSPNARAMSVEYCLTSDE